MATTKNYFAEVQAYKRQHPRVSHASACAAVSKSRKSGAKVSGLKKSAEKKPAARKATTRTVVTVKTASKPASIAGLIGQAKKQLILKLGDLEARKYVAKTKREKAPIIKEITAVKSQIRKIS